MVSKNHDIFKPRRVRVSPDLGARRRREHLPRRLCKIGKRIGWLQMPARLVSSSKLDVSALCDWPKFCAGNAILPSRSSISTLLYTNPASLLSRFLTPAILAATSIHLETWNPYRPHHENQSSPPTLLPRIDNSCIQGRQKCYNEWFKDNRRSQHFSFPHVRHYSKQLTKYLR